ncbi:hypothetical protein PR048_010817 [Dryococelus australis]|uniref:Uncharacterized protein n=1 Tax=Dryococelus australis TaxID=614101 RepID=A0ABQ9I3T6_9NEOP|nr:hypothetical protein PR048_010817 [Dryococelus australis]
MVRRFKQASDRGTWSDESMTKVVNEGLSGSKLRSENERGQVTDAECVGEKLAPKTTELAAYGKDMESRGKKTDFAVSWKKIRHIILIERKAGADWLAGWFCEEESQSPFGNPRIYR